MVSSFGELIFGKNEKGKWEGIQKLDNEKKNEDSFWEQRITFGNQVSPHKKRNAKTSKQPRRDRLL
jgi:hypothetical protein